ncbi:conserved hypothetical protein [Nitrobacter hamburgensis X14]|uniref:TnsA endonuclease N-terminal domain-containing protein n=1 Tax=Nitrobacter hamburgensis (strain DSM 10229 / NCIMB 13809 / X14) TaxID=323097 RepID=Q1QLL5_NITHX|nr:conserved hypothetical protein [Nitrobacter hamburgensis X14]
MIIHSAMPLRTFDLRGEVCYEGALERCCLVVGRLRPDIVKVTEHPPAVTYIDDDGRKRRHIFNFRFTTSDGKRVLVAVKPSALIAISGLDRILELIAAQISPAMADYVMSFTEKKLSRIDTFNVQNVNMATRDPCPENDEVLARVIRKMSGQVSIGELVERSGLEGYGFDAVVRALFAGQLRLVEYCMLDIDTLLMRAPRRRGDATLQRTSASALTNR